MKIGILGTGMVGTTIGSKLIGLGHEVRIGSRSADNAKTLEWARREGPKASHGTFAEAALFGETIFICTNGAGTLNALKLAQPENFKGKTVIDISNPLDFSKGMPPSLFSQWANTNSLGEEVQKALPGARVVKSLNIVNCEVMVDAKKTGGDPTMFVAGNDAKAKDDVKRILGQFGWSDVLDLGDITGARGMEMLVMLWVRIWGTTQNGYFGFKIVQ